MLLCPDVLPVLSKVMVAQLVTDRAVLTPEFPGPKAAILQAPCQGMLCRA